MKAPFEQVKTGNTSSIKVKTYKKKSICVPLHYHPEYEIVFILSGEGKLIMPDAATTFYKRDVLLVGSNVPHLYADVPATEKKGNPESRISVLVVQFRENLFGELIHLPEFKATARFLSELQQGIIIKNVAGMDQIIQGLIHKKSIDRFNTLAKLLERIVKSSSYEMITSSTSNKYINGISPQRLRDFFSILQKNYNRNLTIEEVAKEIHLSKTSLCRFLKKETAKTFSALLNEIRIRYACALLRETSYTIKQVSYEVGFNNPSYFYRLFRKLQEISPKDYKERSCVS